jgi:hypothetical protein
MLCIDTTRIDVSGLKPRKILPGWLYRQLKQTVKDTRLLLLLGKVSSEYNYVSDLPAGPYIYRFMA